MEVALAGCACAVPLSRDALAPDDALPVEVKLEWLARTAKLNARNRISRAVRTTQVVSCVRYRAVVQHRADAVTAKE
eukprot:3807733-Rhodomonas_salina.2